LKIPNVKYELCLWEPRFMQMDIYDEATVVFAIRFEKMSENSILKNMNRDFVY